MKTVWHRIGFSFKAQFMDIRLYYSVFGHIVGLATSERWKAAGDRFGEGILTERWFTLTAVAVIIILGALFVLVTLRRRAVEQSVGRQLFLDYAERSGLTAHERQVLLGIAGKAGLKQGGAIFTMEEAFDRGAARMTEGFVGRRRGTEQSGKLRRELSSLREKLGFQRGLPASVGSSNRPRRFSSRQIPVGRKVYITRGVMGDVGDIEATVVENSDSELTVRSAVPARITFGSLWRVRYYFGAAIWEFDTTVVSCEGDILVLNHNDNVRFINRRRFVRVPVRKPAFFACFPFARRLSPGAHGARRHFPTPRSLVEASDNFWGPPGFVAAVVTELAGPGLRIEAPLEVEVGDRVLVILRLDEEDGASGVARGRGNAAGLKVVQDIGRVRHIEAVQNGFSVAVELTGLSDSDIDELICAANLASVKANAKNWHRRATDNVEQQVRQAAYL